MKRFKNNKLKVSKISIIICVILLASIFLSYFNVNISPKILQISEYSLDTYNNNLIMDFISNDTLSSSNLNNLIELVQNQKGEIIAVNYDAQNSYKILKNITNDLHQIITNATYKDVTDYDFEIKDDLILFYPITLASDYVYFNNIGPKIPVKIKFLSSLTTGITTKVSNYGINNVLVEIYVNVTITDDIVIPFLKKPIVKNYDILLSSKVIMGEVPSYLGGTITNSSPILQN